MLNGYFIADAVIHGWNWLDSNMVRAEAKTARKGTYDAHCNWFSPDPASRLTFDEWVNDWQTRDLEEALFLESGIDLLAYHGTPIYDFFKDGHSANYKGVEWKQREPDRVIYYGAANPLDGRKALDDLTRNRDDGADAVKVYSAVLDAQNRTVP